MSLSSNFPTIRPSLLLDFAKSRTVDPRITFTRASTATYFDEDGVLQTAAVDRPRIDFNPSTLVCNGLLIEESRTNSLRNSTMQGAVAGTPGTLPTNWSVSAGGSGITRELVGTGTENGITYVDFRFSGTGASTAFQVINTDTTTGIAAATGQAWSGSFYLKLVAGSTTGTDIKMQLLELASGSGVVQNLSAALSPTSQNLATQRVTYSATLSGGGTITNLQQGLRLVFTNGVAVDITLRIGLPQLEQGAFATSVIPTTTTALTRNADVASMTGTNFSSWYNASEGTLFAESQKNYSGSTAFPRIVQISDSTNNNALIILWSDSISRLYAAVSVSGVTQADPGNNGLTQTAEYESAFAYKANDFAISNDGLSVQTDTSGTIPTVDRMFIGKDVGSSYLNGTIRRLTYYPARLVNAQLQALTL